MPRRSRLAVAHLPHHLVQRGHNRRAVFVNDRDRLTYLDTLKECRQEPGIKVCAWCLMTNHVHLVIRELASSLPRQQIHYREWVDTGVHDSQLRFIRSAIQRNRLTDSETFSLEIERRTGERILNRGQDRSVSILPSWIESIPLLATSATGRGK